MRVEPNYECPEPGEPCVSTIVCGDGTLSVGEVCDDGNTTDQDGCAADCRTVEAGYLCVEPGEPCVSTIQCGDGRINGTEACDDGNAVGDDGCSADCSTIEEGYVCGTAGQPCVAPEICGNGVVSAGETCDDGNTESGDGCTDNCLIEAFYVCDPPGAPCVSTIVCGNGLARGPEACDDGNTESGDGCSSDCELEAGWICPVQGAACRAAECGDGILADDEECETDFTGAVEACSTECKIVDGYDCDPVERTCAETVCGNSTVERGEQCDDGNERPFDGCYRCVSDPDCNAGTCQSVCGDGQKYDDEECDDGNTRSEDGCSASCELEDGYSCQHVPPETSPTLELPIIFRDFVGVDRGLDGFPEHPDFNRLNASGLLGIVQDELGPTGLPQYNWLPYDPALAGAQTENPPAPLDSSLECSCAATGDPPACTCETATTCVCDNPGHLYQNNSNSRPNMNGPDTFVHWYTDVGGTVNITELGSVILDWNTSLGAYHYDSATADGSPIFNPLVSSGFVASGDESLVTTCNDGGGDRNVSFTSETHFWFEYQGGERFEFSGDDDVWVFVNDRLTLDLGGLHGRLNGWVELDADTDGTDADVADGTATVGSDLLSEDITVDLGLVAGGVYELVMFHAERNQCGSNFTVTLKDFNKPKTECESVCGDGIVTRDEVCDDGAANNTGEYGACGPDCQYRGPFCGDGNVDSPPEACDDGLNTGLYGQCAPGCVLGPYCGDGVLDAPQEQCDDGVENNTGGYDGCESNCTLGPRCGDGILQSSLGELCDDGVNDGSYGPNSCAPGCVPGPRCGDGAVQADEGEQCDDGEENNTGEYGGCNDQCRLGPYCGDGVVQTSEGELCDDGVNDGEYGGCSSDCQYGPFCGDAVVDNPPEVCDDGVNDGGYGECEVGCTYGPFCGDGTVQSPEQCDDGNHDNLDGCSAGCLVEQVVE